MYYYKMDPIGIQEQRDQEKEIEDELQELRVSLAGHFFTFARHRFWKLAGDMPADLRRRFVEYGVSHPAVDDSDKACVTQEFERCFDVSDEICWSWQEEYNDDDDDGSDLLKLLRLLRELANLETFFV